MQNWKRHNNQNNRYVQTFKIAFNGFEMILVFQCHFSFYDDEPWMNVSMKNDGNWLCVVPEKMSHFKFSKIFTKNCKIQIWNHWSMKLSFEILAIMKQNTAAVIFTCAKSEIKSRTLTICTSQKTQPSLHRGTQMMGQHSNNDKTYFWNVMAPIKIVSGISNWLINN